MWKKFQLWLYSNFFVLLVCMNPAGHRRRMSHNNGLGGRGKVKIVDNPTWPKCSFLEPGREFVCRIRHATVPYVDDAMLAVRSLSIKYADTQFESPFDLQMNTGITSFFWNVRTFLQFAFGRDEKDGTEYVKYYRKVSMTGPRNSFRRNPSSFAQLNYYGQTPFEFVALDGVKRYVKFRAIPEDRGPDTGLVNLDLLQTPEQCADQRIIPGETRNKDYLKEEYRKRVLENGVVFHLQLQLHEASPEDTPELFSVMTEWDEATHPWQDYATLTIDETLDYRESIMTAFEVSNLPESIKLIPATSIDDFNSLNYLRKKIVTAIHLRRFMSRLLGLPKDYETDPNCPRNFRAPWT